MMLRKLPVPGRPTFWITVGQGPTVLAVGAGEVVWTFLLSSILSLSLGDAQIQTEILSQRPLNLNQPSNQAF